MTFDHMELNLAGVTFIDAAGARCLLACRHEADNAGDDGAQPNVTPSR